MNTNKKVSSRVKPPRLFGYEYIEVEDRYIAEITNQAEVVHEIFGLFLKERKTLNSIADHLNNKATPYLTAFSKNKGDYDFHFSTISSILRRPEYCGHVRNGIELIESPLVYPNPIIALDDWLFAQYLLSKKSRKDMGSSNEADYPLTGFMNCHCSAKYYIKKKIGYYSHTPPAKSRCNSIQYIKADRAIALILAVVLDHLMQKKFLSAKLNQFQLSFFFREKLSIQQDTIGNEYTLIEPANAKAGLIVKTLLKSESLSLSIIQMTDKQLLDLLQKITNINSIVFPEFVEYIGSSIKKWFATEPKSIKLDLVNDFVEEILVQKESIYVKLGEELQLCIKYKPMNEYWKKKILEFAKMGALWKAIELPKYVSQATDYLSGVCRSLCLQQESSILLNTNEIKLNYLAISKGLSDFPLKIYFPIADYIDTQNTSMIRLRLITYRFNNIGATFADLSSDGVEVNPYQRDGNMITFSLGKDFYFNKRYLHSLPEWFYGYNFEFFRTDKGKICFVEVDSTIQAMKLGKLGKKTPMDFAEALNTIMESTKFQYVDID
jgi:hypothetical protein